MSLPVRLAILAVLFAAIQGVVWTTNRGGLRGEIRLPDRDLAELPLQLGAWHGEATEIDPRIANAVAARRIVNRLYRHPDGRAVRLHAAVFAWYDLQVPHPPPTCFAGAGYKIVGTKDVALDLDDGTRLPARELSMEFEGQPARALYWFQLGDRVVLDRGQLRDARRELSGQAEWPAVVKVLIDTSSLGPAESEAALRDLGKHVAAWTAQLK